MRNVKRFLSLLLSCMFAVFAASCNEKTVKEPSDRIEGESATALSLSEDEISVTCGNTVQLPVPTLATGEGSTTDGVYVEIKKSDGSVYIPKYPYADMTSFRTYEAGTYYIVYSAQAGDFTHTKIAKVYSSDPETPSVTVDGVLNDAAYRTLPTYRTGINGNMNVKLAFEDEGLCVGAEVLDDNLIYNTYVSKKFLQSDGFEICLDLGGEFDTKLNGKCLKIQANVNGVVWISRASNGLALYELDERLVTYSEWKLQYAGTRTDVASEEFKTYTDTDIGYSFELFIPYAQLGFSEIADVIGVSCAHRDVSSNVTSEYQVGASGNVYYAEAALPNGFVEQSNTNTSYIFEQFQPTSLTVLYNKCYLKGAGKGVSNSQKSVGITVDGSKEEFVWEAADVLNVSARSAEGATAQAKVKYYADSKGLYLFFEVTDAVVSANASGEVYANDCVEVNIADADAMNGNAAPDGFSTHSRTLAISATGQRRTAYLNKEGYTFVGGFDHLYAVARTESGYCVEIFIPAYEIGLDQFDACAISVGLVNCDGARTKASDAVYSHPKNKPNGYQTVWKGVEI